MSILLCVAGTKGGTGKSTILRYIIDWLEENGIDPLLIDCDDENATLSRFFERAKKLLPHRSKSYDTLIRLIEEGNEPLIVADIKAGAGFDMLSWFAEVPWEELRALGVMVVMIGVITSSPDSVSSLMRWVDALGKKVRWIVVKNLKDSDATGLDPASVSFPEYDLTRQALEFRKKYKPAEILMPGLDPEYQGELERLNLTIRDVLERKPGVPNTLTPLMVRARLRRYQDGLYRQFATLRDLLLP